MLAARVFSRFSRSSLNQCGRLLLPSGFNSTSPTFSDEYSSIVESSKKVAVLGHSMRNTTNSRGFWFSSSASTQHSEDPTRPVDGQETTSNVETTETKGDDKASEKSEHAGSGSETKPSSSKPPKRKRRGTKPVAFSDSDTDAESNLSVDELLKSVAEKEGLLKEKHAEIQVMQDQVLRTYADMENIMDRTKREAENSKKFAVQNFAKNLLDVADNLGRASSVVKDSFLKIDPSKDAIGAVPLLKTLLEGVEMTDKQLVEVFRKYGVEKYDPLNEQFDPKRHNAITQIPDASKPAGTIATVLKPGYVLHDRVLRPAEVSVTEAPKSEGETEQSSSNETQSETEKEKSSAA